MVKSKDVQLYEQPLRFADGKQGCFFRQRRTIAGVDDSVVASRNFTPSTQSASLPGIQSRHAQIFQLFRLWNSLEIQDSLLIGP